MLLFKRVGESFNRIEGREWALLFLETLGVLAGILIAFELNEWAVRRSDAAKHQEIMERLLDEAQQDVAKLRDVRDLMRRLTDSESRFATQLSSGTCPAGPLWTSVFTVSRYPALEAPRSVYQELMGAGGLSSIEDSAVRESIARFNSRLAFSESQNEYFRSVTVQRKPVSFDDPRVTVRFDRDNRNGPEIATYDRQALCSDHAFRNRMVDATRNHVVALSWHETMTRLAIRMCGTLAKSLDRTCRPSFGGKLDVADARALTDESAGLGKTLN